MKSLVIATLTLIGLATCACSSLGAPAPQVTGPAPAAHTVTVHHRHRHHYAAAVTAADPGPAAGPAGYPAATCAPVTAHWLQVFPPNQTVPIYLHFTSTACAKPVKLLTVNVVVPGSGG